MPEGPSSPKGSATVHADSSMICCLHSVLLAFVLHVLNYLCLTHPSSVIAILDSPFASQLLPGSVSDPRSPLCPAPVPSTYRGLPERLQPPGSWAGLSDAPDTGGSSGCCPSPRIPPAFRGCAGATSSRRPSIIIIISSSSRCCKPWSPRPPGRLHIWTDGRQPAAAGAVDCAPHRWPYLPGSTPSVPQRLCEPLAAAPPPFHGWWCCGTSASPSA